MSEQKGQIEADPSSEIPGQEGEVPDTPWTVLDTLVERYVNDYELVDAEDEQGNTGDYSPTGHERMLILDAINGLLCNSEFIEQLVAARDWLHAQNRAEGRCEYCGAPIPEHWGVNCRGAAPGPPPARDPRGDG